MTTGTFPSKILLFGEYLVLFQAKALAMPFPHYYAILKPRGTAMGNIEVKFSNQALQGLYQYVRTTIDRTSLYGRFDLDTFKSDIDNGLYCDSNIPIGYGIGSSGAIVAALYDRYVHKREEMAITLKTMLQAKKEMAYLESFFDGNSSGVDQLVCYFDKPLLFQDSSIEIAMMSLKDIGQVYLVDTGTSRKTGNLVKQFLENCKDANYLASIQDMVSSNNSCISALMDGDNDKLYRHLSRLSALQFTYFRPMILPSLLAFWEQSLSASHFTLKLCGSGGGGFLLAFVNNVDAFLSSAKLFNLSVLPI